MGLYPKKLRNIDELEQERKALLKEKAKLEEEDLFSVGGLLGGKKDDGEESGGLGSLLDMLPVSNPIVSMVTGMVKDRLNKKEPKEQRRQTEGGKKERSIVTKIAIELIGGYLKWKAIELSYKGIKHLIKTRKEKE